MIIHYPASAEELYVYDPDTLAYLGYNEPLYYQARRIALNELVTGLKADGIWAKIYQLMIYAAPSAYGYPGNYPDTSQAKLNLKPNPYSYYDGPSQFTPTAPSYPPPYTPWRGFNMGAGPGLRLLRLELAAILNYYVVNSAPVLLTPNLLNNFSFGFWSLTDSQSAGGDIGIVDYYNEFDFVNSVYVPQYPVGWAISARSATDELRFRVNSELEYTAPNTNSRGLFIGSRLNATEMTVSRNGVPLATQTAPSKSWYQDLSFPGQDLVVGQGGLGGPYCYIGGTWQRPISQLYGSSYNEADLINPSGREYCLHWLGQGLTSVEQLALFNRLRDYLLVLMPAADLGV